MDFGLALFVVLLCYFVAIGNSTGLSLVLPILWVFAAYRPATATPHRVVEEAEREAERAVDYEGPTDREEGTYRPRPQMLLPAGASRPPLMPPMLLPWAPRPPLMHPTLLPGPPRPPPMLLPGPPLPPMQWRPFMQLPRPPPPTQGPPPMPPMRPAEAPRRGRWWTCC